MCTMRASPVLIGSLGAFGGRTLEVGDGRNPRPLIFLTYVVGGVVGTTFAYLLLWEV